MIQRSGVEKAKFSEWLSSEDLIKSRRSQVCSIPSESSPHLNFLVEMQWGNCQMYFGPSEIEFESTSPVSSHWLFQSNLYQSKLNSVGHSRKRQQTQFALKVPRWHHNSATIFRLVRQCMGLMISWFGIFRARLILLAFVVPKLRLLFTSEGWSAQPYSIKFDLY